MYLLSSSFFLSLPQDSDDEGDLPSPGWEFLEPEMEDLFEWVLKQKVGCICAQPPRHTRCPVPHHHTRPHSPPPPLRRHPPLQGVVLPGRVSGPEKQYDDDEGKEDDLRELDEFLAARAPPAYPAEVDPNRLKLGDEASQVCCACCACCAVLPL